MTLFVIDTTGADIRKDFHVVPLLGHTYSQEKSSRA